MEEFPFTADEWDAGHQQTTRVLNATLADDTALRASCFVDLQLQLEELRSKYGDHPVLLETEADFSDAANERLQLYEAAFQVAVREKLPISSICLELAELQLEFGRWEDAKTQLRYCEAEIRTLADSADFARWQELLRQANPG